MPFAPPESDTLVAEKPWTPPEQDAVVKAWEPPKDDTVISQPAAAPAAKSLLPLGYPVPSLPTGGTFFPSQHAGEVDRMALGQTPPEPFYTKLAKSIIGAIPSATDQEWQGGFRTLGESLIRGTMADAPYTPGQTELQASQPPILEVGEGPAGNAAKVAAGVGQSINQMSEFFLSPVGIATLGMGMMPKAAQKAVALYFAGSMIHGAPQIAQELAIAIEEGDTERIAKSTADAAQTLGFSVGAGVHGVRPEGRLGEQINAKLQSYLPKPEPAPSIAAPSLEAVQRLKAAGLPETARVLFETEGQPLPQPELTVSEGKLMQGGKPAVFSMPPEDVSKPIRPPPKDPMSPEEAAKRFGVIRKQEKKRETPTQVQPAEAISKDEQLVTENLASLVARTKVGAERDEAFANRAEAGKRLSKTLQPGDVLVDPDGTRHVVDQVFSDGTVFSVTGAELTVGSVIGDGGRIERQGAQYGTKNQVKPSAGPQAAEVQAPAEVAGDVPQGQPVEPVATGKGINPITIAAYHFTTEKPFQQFDPKKIGSSAGHSDPVAGFYLTNNPRYKGNIPEGQESGFNRYEADVTLSNPLRLKSYNDVDQWGEDGATARRNIEKAGYDGVIFGNGDEIVAFNPEQVAFHKPSQPLATGAGVAAKAPVLMTPDEHTGLYPVVSPDAMIDGRTIRNADTIPNMSSIRSSINNPKVLPGIREVPMSDFALTGKHYSVEGQKRIDSLASAIQESGEITPLIVVRDREGAYILEGATRADALFKLGAKSFPAKVVLDMESIGEKSPPPANAPGRAELTVYHGGPETALQSNWPKWFTTNRERAKAYGKGNVFEAKVTPENPHFNKFTLSPEEVDRLFLKGHDAIVIGTKENPIDVILKDDTSAGFRLGTGRAGPAKSGNVPPAPGKRAVAPSAGQETASGADIPQRINPAKLTDQIASEPDYVYHATNTERLQDIADSGKLKTHRPDYGTDQDAWPDGSTEKRSYFSDKANVVWQFAPEEGKPVVIRTKGGADFAKESTGDTFSRRPVPISKLEYLGEDGNWHPVNDLSTRKKPAEPAPAPSAPAKPAPVPEPAEMAAKKPPAAIEAEAQRQAAVPIRVGDRIEWNQSGNKTATGKVLEILPSGAYRVETGLKTVPTKTVLASAKPRKVVAPAQPSAEPKPLNMAGQVRPEPKPFTPPPTFETLHPKAQEKFNAAWEAKDVGAMQELVRLANKGLRAEFARRTGVKLPNTEGGTLTTLKSWAGGAFEKPTPPEPGKKKTKAETESEDKARKQAETIIGIIDQRAGGSRVLSDRHFKRAMENAYSTMKLHAGKLGLDIPRLGTYFAEGEYRSAAARVLEQLGSKREPTPQPGKPAQPAPPAAEPKLKAEPQFTTEDGLKLAEQRKVEGKSQLAVARELADKGLSDGDATGIAAQTFKAETPSLSDFDASQLGRLRMKRQQGRDMTDAEQKHLAELEKTSTSTPTEAVKEVKKEVQKVAKTEGQRPAKEVKAELIQKLEKAIEGAVNAEDVGSELNDKTGLWSEPKWGKFPKNVESKITIEIPGDGTFTVWNTKENLAELLRKAKALETSPVGGKGFRERRPSKAESQQYLAEAEVLAKSTPTGEAEMKLFGGGKSLGQSLRDKLPKESQSAFDQLPQEIQQQHGIANVRKAAIHGEEDAGFRYQQKTDSLYVDPAHAGDAEALQNEVIASWAFNHEATERPLYEAWRKAAFPKGQLAKEGFGGFDQADSFARSMMLWLKGEANTEVARVLDERFQPKASAGEAEMKGLGGAGAISTPGAPLGASASGHSLPVKSQSQIIRDLAKGLNVPVRFGRLTTSKFGGYWKRVQNLIGSKRANDIPIVSHEVGHKITDRFGWTSDRTLSGELMALGDPARPGSRSSWTPSKSLVYRRSEGGAEFLRLWLTDTNEARIAAPNLYREFESILTANKDLADVFYQAREDINLWRTAQPEARLDAHISVGDNPNGTRYRLPDLTRDLVDDLHYLRLAVDHAKRSGDVRPSQDPYLLARLLRGSAGESETFIRRGVVNFNTRRVTPDSGLEHALQPVAGRINEFRRWIVAKRAQELHSQGRETGLLTDDVNAVAVKYDGEATFHDAFQRVKEWQDAVLDYAVDAGLVERGRAATATEPATGSFAIRAMNQDYVPFHRVFEIGAGEVPAEQTGGVGRGLNVGTPGSLRRLRGSQRDIVDPLETMVKNAYTLITAADKNAVSVALADFANRPDMGRWVEKVATPKQQVRVGLEKVREQLEDAGADLSALPDDLMLSFFQNAGRAPQGENIIKVNRGGQMEYYRLNRELYQTFHSLDAEDTGRIIQFLGAPAQVLRAGVTLTPDFALANAIRDTVSAAVVSRHSVIPFELTARGLFHLLRNPQMVSEWAASGGRQSIEATYFDRNKLQRFMRERITKDMTAGDITLQWLKSPLTAMRQFTGLLEEATRIGEYDTVFRKSIRQGMSEGDARRLAAFESRDLQDFAKGGAQTKILRRLAAFWNAAVQGNVKLYESFRQRPIKTALMGLAFVTLPKMLEQAFNWDDDDYWDRPQWERDLFFLIPYGKDDNSRTKFLRIPTPFEVGIIFGTFPGRLMQWARENDPAAMQGFPSLFLKQTVPNPMPQSVLTALEVSAGPAGYSYFRGRPIVPSSLEREAPPFQFTEQNSVTARKAGELLNVSPMKIDYAIRGLSGGLGSVATHQIVDRPLAAVTGEERTARQAVPGGRFITTPAGIQSEGVEKFYERLAQLRQQKRPGVKVAGLEKMEDTARDIAKLRRKARAETNPILKQRKYLEIAEKAKKAVRN